MRSYISVWYYGRYARSTGERQGECMDAASTMASNSGERYMCGMTRKLRTGD